MVGEPRDRPGGGTEGHQLTNLPDPHLPADQTDEGQQSYPDHTEVIAAATARIKARMAGTIRDLIEIGRDLIRVKSLLSHGEFMPWLEREFNMAGRTARNYMVAADFVDQRLAGKVETVSHFAPADLYAIAAPRAPEEVVDGIVAAMNRGAKLTGTEAAKRVKDAKRRLAEEKAFAKLDLTPTPFVVGDAAADRLAGLLRERLGEDLAELVGLLSAVGAREVANRLAN